MSEHSDKSQKDLALLSDSSLLMPFKQASISTAGVQKLNGHNFLPWKRQIVMILKLKNLHSALTEDVVDPEIDMRATLILLETMDDGHKLQIQAEESAKLIMRALEKQYADVSVANLHRLLMKFLSHTKTSDSVSAHIGKLKEYKAELVSLGQMVTEELFQVIIIKSMPPEFGDLLGKWGRVHSSQKTVEFLTGILIQKERKLEDAPKAFVAKPENNWRNMSISEKKKVSTCKACGKKGHWAAECRAKMGSRQWCLNPRLNNKNWFRDLKMLDKPTHIAVGDGYPLLVLGIGTIDVLCQTGSGQIQGQLANVSYVPTLATNLFSVGTAADLGILTTFGAEKCHCHYNKGPTVLTGTRLSKDLYLLDIKVIPRQVSLVCKESLHEALGHPSDRRLAKLLKDDEIEVKINPKRISNCISCPAGKGTRASHPTRHHTGKGVGEVVHIDTVHVTVQNNAKYHILCKDESSEFCLTYFINSKQQTDEIIQQLLIDFETSSKKKIQSIHCDNGSELVSRSIKMLLLREGVRLETSSPYTPQQNGLVERAVRTIHNMARTMMVSSKLPAEVTSEAIKTAVYLNNRLPTTRSDKTPFERFFGTKPEMSNLVKFGEPVQLLTIDRRTNKFEPRTRPGFIVGYTSRSNTYRIFDGSKVVETCDFYFSAHEEYSAQEHSKQEEPPTRIEMQPIIIKSNHSSIEKSRPEKHKPRQDRTNGKRYISPEELTKFFEEQAQAEAQDITQEVHEEDSFHERPAANQTFEVEKTPRVPTISTPPQEQEETEQVSSDVNLYSTTPTTNATAPPAHQMHVDSCPLANPNPIIVSQATHPPHTEPPPVPPHNTGDQNRGPSVFGFLAQASIHDEPQSYSEAILEDEAEEWRQAIDDEFRAHEVNDTWVVIDQPKGVRTLTTKWVFKKKTNSEGVVERFKARLVARGFQQRAAIDYDQTYAPVAHPASIRTLLALAAAKNLHFAQFDVTTAFLYGPVEEDIYLSPPKGLKLETSQCLKLNKALYGLKQAPRAWNSKFSASLQELKFQQLKSESCVYVNRQTETYIATYVDDGIVVSQDADECLKTIHTLNRYFKTNEVKSNIFLGLQINKTETGLEIHQQKYIADLLDRFDLENSNGVTSPLVNFRELSIEEQDELTDKPYQALVGSLLFCALNTRPDILYPTIFLSRFGNSPRSKHWRAATRVARYLKETKDLAILFPRGDGNIILEAYSDADLGGDPRDRKSTSGIVIKLSGCPISFRSKKQTFTALSTCGAEYIAASKAAQELMAIVNLLSELGVEHLKPTLNIDNQPALHAIKNEGPIEGLKHVQLKQHHLRDLHCRNLVTFQHVAGEDQTADLLTKPQNGQRLQTLRQKIGLRKISSLILLFMSLIGCIASEKHWDITEAPWVVWQPSHMVSSIGQLQINITYQFVDPCKIYSRTKESLNEKTIATSMAYDRVMVRCIEMMNNKFEPAWNRLKVASQIKHHTISKRLVDPATALVVVGVLVVASLVGWAWYFIDPNSPYNTTPQMRKEIEILKNGTQSFFNITAAQNEALSMSRSVTERLVNKTEELRKDHQSDVIALADLTWLTSGIVNNLQDTIEDLNDLADSWKLNQPSLRNIRKLLDWPSFNNYTDDAVKWQSLTVEDGKIEMVISIRLTDRDTIIAKADPFHPLVNLTTVEPLVLNYTGPQYALKNFTNNCTIGIAEVDKWSYDKCLEENYSDPRFQSWKSLKVNLSDYKYEDKVKTSPLCLDYAFAYCPFHHFWASQKRWRCPAWPFKLPLYQNYTVANYTHRGEICSLTRRSKKLDFEMKNLNASLSVDPAYHDTLELVTQLRGKHEAIHKLIEESQNAFKIPTTGTEAVVWSIGISGSFLAALGLGATLAYCAAIRGTNAPPPPQPLHNVVYTTICSAGHTNQKRDTEPHSIQVPEEPIYDMPRAEPKCSCPHLAPNYPKLTS